jgi:uncharacterized protein YuzE
MAIPYMSVTPTADELKSWQRRIAKIRLLLSRLPISKRNGGMTLEHDTEADAIYIRLTDAPYAYGKDLDTERRIDYAADGTPRGIELLCVSHGVILDNLPYPREITKLLRSLNLKVFA